MRITDVQAIVLRLREISDAADGTQDDLIVRVETDEGIVGYGEADTSPYVGKVVIDAAMSHGTCYRLREIVVGLDPLDHQQAWREMWSKTYYYGRTGPAIHAMSAIDMALWDIKGKALGLPARSRPEPGRATSGAGLPCNPIPSHRRIGNGGAWRSGRGTWIRQICDGPRSGGDRGRCYRTRPTCWCQRLRSAPLMYD